MPLEFRDLSATPLEQIQVCGAFGSSENAIVNMEAVLRMTQSFFPGEVKIELSVDPEYPQQPSIVFHVANVDSLSVEGVLDRELQWQNAIGKIAPESRDRLRLFVE